MDILSGVSTRVVMLVTEGIFSTAVMTLAVFLFAWRVGLFIIAGLAVYYAVNHALQAKSEQTTRRKFAGDTAVVERVLECIRFGQPDAPMEKVIAAAKKARCHDFILKLPQGYETVIGEAGGTLSGGERQRLSIARAMMKDAPIIILDEATANVDPENEKELMEAISALTQEKTIIMIAHRLKTVRHADQILVVDKGQIVQRGTHDELMKQDGIYRHFISGREKAVGWKL